MDKMPWYLKTVTFEGNNWTLKVSRIWIYYLLIKMKIIRAIKNKMK